METFNRPAQPHGSHRPGANPSRILTRLALLALTIAPAGAHAAADICEGKSGPELIRCIEAAARTPAGKAQDAPAPPPKQSAQVAKPAPSVPLRVTTPEPPRPVVVEPPRPPAEDCTGREGQALRTCLAAGGRLSPQAAVIAPSPARANAAPGTVGGAEQCDGKSGEEARRCIEQAARAATARPGQTGPKVLNCTLYHAADQKLCLHRNTALLECRNRQKYPDEATCVRSLMTTAPEPLRADCARGSGAARAQCEARNRVFATCSSDRMGYFDCLEHRLGPDAHAKR